MGDLDEFLSDYDDATDDVINSQRRNYLENLKRWFTLIDENPIAGPILKSLQQKVDAKKWFEQQESAKGSMVGSGVLNWPTTREDFLAMRLGLFREFSIGSIDVLNFGIHFYYPGSTRFDATLNEISTQLFQPTVRDFKKHLDRTIRDLDVGDIALASDRIVNRSDNSEKFDEAVRLSTDVITAFKANNSYENIQEKERLIAEISSGRDLLRAAEARREAIKATIWTALKYLSKKIVDNALNILIASALFLIASIFGL